MFKNGCLGPNNSNPKELVLENYFKIIFRTSKRARHEVYFIKNE